MLSEDHYKTRKKQPCHVCHTGGFCRLLLPAVLLRKLTIVDDDDISSQFVQAFGASSAMSKFLSVLTLVL